MRGDWEFWTRLGRVVGRKFGHPMGAGAAGVVVLFCRATNASRELRPGAGAYHVRRVGGAKPSEHGSRRPWDLVDDRIVAFPCTLDEAETNYRQGIAILRSGGNNDLPWRASLIFFENKPRPSKWLRKRFYEFLDLTGLGPPSWLM